MLIWLLSSIFPTLLLNWAKPKWAVGNLTAAAHYRWDANRLGELRVFSATIQIVPNNRG